MLCGFIPNIMQLSNLLHLHAGCARSHSAWPNFVLGCSLSPTYPAGLHGQVDAKPERLDSGINTILVSPKPELHLRRLRGGMPEEIRVSQCRMAFRLQQVSHTQVHHPCAVW